MTEDKPQFRDLSLVDRIGIILLGAAATGLMGLLGYGLGKPSIQEVKSAENNKGIEYVITKDGLGIQRFFVPNSNGAFPEVKEYTSAIRNGKVKYFFDSNNQAYVFNGKDYVKASPDISGYLNGYNWAKKHLR